MGASNRSPLKSNFVFFVAKKGLLIGVVAPLCG
jgi:hypothetical protein